MAADVISSILGITLQGTGNNNNVWGTILNENALQLLERGIAGSKTTAVTGGTLDLSGSAPPAGVSKVLDFIQIFNGALTSKQIIIVPNITKTSYIFNDTTGAFPLHVQASGGNLVQIPQGTGKFVICDGAGNMLRLDKDQVGDFVMTGAASRPGALACDGSSYLRTDYPDLFAKIGTTFGTVDSTHFTVPLLTDTNRYLRAAGGTLTVGTYQANQNLAHTHAGASFSGTTGTENNSHAHTFSGGTGSESANHQHTFDPHQGGEELTNGIYPGGGSGGSANTSSENTAHSHSYSGGTNTESANHGHSYSGTTGSIPSSGGTEARPESLAVYIGITY